MNVQEAVAYAMKLMSAKPEPEPKPEPKPAFKSLSYRTGMNDEGKPVSVFYNDGRVTKGHLHYSRKLGQYYVMRDGSMRCTFSRRSIGKANINSGGVLEVRLNG